MAQSNVPVENAAPQVSLLTIGPGAIYWERFGHNAIVVRDPALPYAVAYNYGLFDFRQRNFFLNFARGRMMYRVAAQDLADDLAWYGQERRWAREQVLRFTPAQAIALRDFLEWNAQPQNAEYRYDYFLSNCSTRVRDALDGAIGGALKRALEGAPAGVSWRHEVQRLGSPDALLMVAMDGAIGIPADAPIDRWQRGFVPMELMQALREVRVPAPDGAGGSVPLVAAERELLPVRLPEPPAAPPRLWVAFLACGLVLGALLLACGRAQGRAGRIAFPVLAGTMALVFGLAGLVLVALWTLTEHWAAHRNLNLLLVNPLLLVLLPALLRRRPGRASAWLAAALALAALLCLPLALLGAPQQNLHWVLLMLPVLAAMAATLARRGGAASG